MKPTQTDSLYQLLSDGKPHCTKQIMAEVYGSDHCGLARVGARIYDIKRKYGARIIGWHDKDNPALYWYQIAKNLPDISERVAKYLVNDPKRWVGKAELVEKAISAGYTEEELLGALNELLDLGIIKREDNWFSNNF